MVETPRHPSDEELIADIARGNRQALGELYDRHASTMMAVAVRMLGDTRAAEDLLHDVFLEIWRRADTYAPERARVLTWCLVRLRSRAMDRLRSRQRTPETPMPDHAELEHPTVESPANSADHERLRIAVETLPQAQREVLELAYFDGLSGSEIAQRLGIPHGTVKSRAAAGLRALRDALAEPD